MQERDKKGFTLIELLIIIGIIGFLAAAILVAVDPVQRVQEARNAKRWAEVNAMLNAILTKQVDARALYSGDDGARLILTDTTSAGAQMIVRGAPAGLNCAVAANRPGCKVALDVTTSATSCVADLDAATQTATTLVPNYMAEIPFDPVSGGSDIASPCGTGSGCTTEGDMQVGPTTTVTGYYIHRTTGNRVEIGSCYPDQSATISVKR